ncbi:Stk1 family PASTA domain-containing Ser/Thr kinase [Georgenia sp. MJ173]
MDEVPKVLGGRYEVHDLIGRGGMAEVYIGHDRRLSRTVAIKVLRSDLARDPMFQTRFRREAQSAAALNHPAIVSVYDTGEDDVVTTRGESVHVPYIVMEYVEGHTVRSLLTDGTAVPIDEAGEIVVGVLSALAYSHREGIVHRDIKPGNVMLTPTGQVKVMDFGIARAMADSAATMTQTHAVVGTAQYLSPEQARGEVVDARSDIYSTGCLLYELLTGKPPFSGDSAVAVAYQHVREIPRPPSEVAADIPEALDRIVLKSLAKDREERYPDADAMRTDLEKALRGGAVSAPAANTWAAAAAAQPTTVVSGPATRAMPAAAPATATTATVNDEDEDEESRSPWWVWLLVLIGLAAAIAVAYLLITDGEEEEPPPPTAVEVPVLDGMDEAQVRAELEEEGLVLNIGDPQFSDAVEEGLFVSADPEVGTEVEPGEAVTVRFSAGPDSVAMPDVRGMTQVQARDTLDRLDLDLRYRTESVDDPRNERDRVSEVEPAVGDPVSAGSEVTLVLATGNVEVPDLRGMPLEEAQEVLSDLTITPGTPVQQETGDHDPGTVIDQDREGPGIPRFSTITLTVAIEVPTPDPTTDEPTDEPTTEDPPPGDEPTTEDPPPGDEDPSPDAGIGTTG